MRLGWRQSIWSALLAVLLGVADCMPSEAEVYTIPAHWTGSTDKVEPVVEDFSFDAMDFLAPNEGWIVGYRFLLHIREDGLTRTFVDPEEAWLSTVDFLGPDEGWVGGFRHAESGLIEGVIWHYQGDRWLPADLTPLGLEGWGVHTVRFASPQRGWALGWHDPVREHKEGVVLTYEGETWSADSFPHSAGRQWTLIDMCISESGDGWAVGKYREGGGEAKPLLAAVSEDGWHAAEIPADDVATGFLSHVICLPGGKAMASGKSGKILAGDAILFAYDGAWRRIELPEKFRSMQIMTLEGLSLDDFWLSLFEAPFTVPLVHFKDGDWIEVQRPVMPHGGIQGYTIRDIHFVSSDEAWAIGNDGNGPGLSRGLVLHYRDGVWRNRNWNWHFWDERWFGLLGR